MQMRVVLAGAGLLLSSCAEITPIRLRVALHGNVGVLASYSVFVKAGGTKFFDGTSYPAGSTVLEVILPPPMIDNLQLGVFGIAGDGCATASWKWETKTLAPGTYDIALDADPRRLCPVQIATEDPTGLNVGTIPPDVQCYIHAGQSCQMFLDASLEYELAPQPTPRSFVRRWTGSCLEAGNSRCRVRATEPQSLTLELAEKRCSARAAGWCVEELPKEAALFRLQSISGSSDDNVWAVGWSGAMLHFDGSSWKVEPQRTDIHLTSVSVVDAEHVWAVGPASVVLRRQSGKWQQLRPGDWGFGDTQKVVARSVESVAIAGNQTFLELHQKELKLVATADFYKFLGLGRVGERIFATSSSGLLIERADDQFKPRATGSTATLRSVSGVAPNDVWAVGDNIIHFKDGTTVFDARGPFRDIRVEDANTVWVTADNNQITRYDAQHQRTRIDVSDLDLMPRPLTSIWSNDGSDLWIVGDPGLILRYVRTTPKVPSTEP